MSLETKLNKFHKDLGAKMGDFAGYDMPLQYSSPQEEVAAVRNGAGVFDVSHMGEFFVTGKQAVEFVDSMLPNDFAKLPLNKAMYSPLCHENGGIVDDLIAYKLADEKVMICVNAANIQKDFEYFQKFAGNFECKLADHSDQYSLLAIQGPKSLEVIHTLYPDSASVEKFGLLVLNQDDNNPIILARTGYTGEDGFEVFVPHSEIETLWDNLMQAKVVPCGLVARDVLRLEACYPLYGHELNDELSPLETGLKWTVKMDKANFVGKAALESRENKHKQIKIYIEKGIPREGYKIFSSDEQEIGVVTSGTYSPTLKKGIAMGLIGAENKLADDYKIQVRKNLVDAKRIKKSFLSLI